MEILSEIMEWVNRNSAPNESHKYSRCVVCGSAWWDNQEQHNFLCWVPRAKKAAEQALAADGDAALLPCEHGYSIFEYCPHEGCIRHRR